MQASNKGAGRLEQLCTKLLLRAFDGRKLQKALMVFSKEIRLKCPERKFKEREVKVRFIITQKHISEHES